MQDTNIGENPTPSHTPTNLFQDVDPTQPLPPMPLNAVWLTNPVMVIKPDGQKIKTVRVGLNDLVKYDGAGLATEMDHPTHLVTFCYGSKSGGFEISLMHIRTQEMKLLILTDGPKN